MLLFNWLTHLRTHVLHGDLSRQPARRRSATRRLANRSASEVLEVRSLLSGNPVAALADDHGGDESCTAHADDPVRQGEHCVAMALATPAAATHAAVATGDWSDANVWANGAVPTEGADVYIPANMTVTVDGVIDEILHTIRIDGTLRFNPSVDTRLTVDTIVGASGSRLEMGTAENPIAADVSARIIIADTGAIDRNWDPFAISRGVILHGTTVIHGAAKTSWDSLATAPRRGDTSLTLTSVPDGWRVGDQLVIAGVSDEGTGDETARVAAIDGNRVTLDRALNLNHLPPSDEFRVHVANTTRNAVIQSLNPALDRRGHVMFMHSRDVNVAYGGFYELGRTNKMRAPDDAVVNADGTLVAGTGTNVRGRYSVHFHRNGVQQGSGPAIVRGSAVVGSPGWGYVNHSSYVEMTDNVAFNVDGSAFVTEAGDEIGSYVRNLAIRTHGTEGDADVEREPGAMKATASGCRDRVSRSNTTSPPERPAAVSGSTPTVSLRTACRRPRFWPKTCPTHPWRKAPSRFPCHSCHSRASGTTPRTAPLAARCSSIWTRCGKSKTRNSPPCANTAGNSNRVWSKT